METQQQPLEMDINELTKILNNSKLKNSTIKKYLAILKRLNKLMGWEPFDSLHFDKINKNIRKVKDAIKAHYTLTTTDKFREKISCLSSLMSYGFPNEENKLKILVNYAGTQLSLPDTREKKNVEKWQTLVGKLTELAEENSYRGIIALVFCYGYVLRSNELFTTSLVKTDEPNVNYLDLENNIWYVKNGKSGKREFAVEKDFSEKIKQKCAGQKYLIEKPGGGIFGASSRRLTYKTFMWPFEKNSLIRSSFETYNIKNNSDDEQKYYFNVLGHKATTAEVHYKIESSDASSSDSSERCVSEDDASVCSIYDEQDEKRDDVKEYDVKKEVRYEPVNIEVVFDKNLKITHLNVKDIEIEEQLGNTYNIDLITGKNKTVKYKNIVDYTIF